MAINRLKVMLSFMREISDGNVPKAEDYELEHTEFNDIVDACQDEGLIKGARFTRGSRNRILLGLFEDVKLTVKGMQYLDEHSTAMKTYKGLKELREWLPF